MAEIVMKEIRYGSSYSQSSYDRYNDWSIALAKQFLTKLEYVCIDKEGEDYNIDIKTIKNNEVHWFEVETCDRFTFTNMEDHPHPTVSFLGRKKKWAKIGFNYLILQPKTLAVAMNHSKNIYKDKYRKKILVDSPDRNKKEVVYRVPKELCYFTTFQIVGQEEEKGLKEAS